MKSIQQRGRTLIQNLSCALFVTAGLLGASSCVKAQTWPSRTVAIVNPAAPGGSSDPLARIVAEILSKEFGGSFIVENRPGANGNIGAAYVAKSAPDGNILLMSWTGTLVSAVTMYGSKPFNPMTDFEPIVLIGSIPNVITVDAKLPITNLKELAEYAKKNPNGVNFGSTGSGSSWHLSAELFNKVMGVKMTHVPYNSPAAVTKDLVGGELQAVFPGTMTIATLVKEGRLRALAVMAPERTSVLPDVPTTKELGYPQLESATWMALLAPKGTPKEITSKINKAINDSLATPAMRNRLTSLGYTPMGGTSAEFSTYMAGEIKKWDEIVKFSGAKID